VEPPKTKLSRIGATIRAELDAEPSGALRLARAGLLARVTARNAARARPGWLRSTVGRHRRATAALAGALAVAAAAVVWLRMPISYQVVGPSGVLAHLDDMVQAGTTEPIVLRFSEGSAIVLGAGGRVRVLSAGPTGARVLLERGTADVSIAHRMRLTTRWRFEAGPFHLLVTGTRFHLGWSPNDEAFTLATSEGSVQVSGPCLNGPRAVSAGQALHLSCPVGPRAASRPRSAAAAAATPAAAQVSAIAAAAAPAALAPTPAAAAAAPEAPSTATTAPAEAPRPVGAAPSAGAPARDTWRDLIRAGRLADGVRAAERADFGHVCHTASEGELLALADAARLSDHTTHAVAALAVLRRRFPGSPDAATAAFTLGRIAFERSQAYDEAVRWFATYLQEQPSGPLMGDAAGRLMEARQRSGDRAGARAEAQRYLRRFPEGPYAPQARALLQD
jgi:TolA-binding protein